jgi:uncharacterized protein (DUF1778 family)
MTTADTAAARRETLNIRIRPEERGLIDRAARSRGKNRTDFILDAARAAAEEALLDQTLLAVGADAWEAFVARLDAPPQSNEQLRRTMRTPAPWEPGR